MFSPVPCKNCITLSACRASLNNGTVANLLYVMNKCSLFKEYVVDKTLTVPIGVAGRGNPVVVKKDIYRMHNYKRIAGFLIKGLRFSTSIDDVPVSLAIDINALFEAHEIVHMLKAVKAKSTYSSVLNFCSKIGIRPPFPPCRKSP